jgi:formylglycine-generating enzyme required for sulfatase activity
MRTIAIWRSTLKEQTMNYSRTILTIGLCVVSCSSLLADELKTKKNTKGSPLELLKVFASEFVEITPGQGKYPKSFQMGSKNDANEQPVHQVTFGCNFGFAKYEVPQNLYTAVLGSNPSRWTGPRNSVEMFDYQDAVKFCKKATVMMREAKLIKADEEIRLPSESEWEYCCRAGSKTNFGFGNDARTKADIANEAAVKKNKDASKDELRSAITKATNLSPYGWHTGNAAGNDPPVGALKPNAWGLYDMHGYLWEFVADDWSDTYAGVPADGGAFNAQKKNSKRVVRSGSWRELYSKLTSTARWGIAQDFKRDDIGLRCVRAKVKSE